MEDDLRQRLAPGDLVLVEHYFTGDREKGYPGRMLLAEVNRDWGHSITPRKMTVLYPINDTICPLFEVRSRYRGIEYILSPNGKDIAVPKNEFNHPIHLGRTKVLDTLDKTPQYKPYADVLRVTDPVLLTTQVDKDLAFLFEDAKIDS